MDGKENMNLVICDPLAEANGNRNNFIKKSLAQFRTKFARLIQQN